MSAAGAFHGSRLGRAAPGRGEAREILEEVFAQSPVDLTVWRCTGPLSHTGAISYMLRVLGARRGVRATGYVLSGTYIRTIRSALSSYPVPNITIMFGTVDLLEMDRTHSRLSFRKGIRAAFYSLFKFLTKREVLATVCTIPHSDFNAILRTAAKGSFPVLDLYAPVVQAGVCIRREDGHSSVFSRYGRHEAAAPFII